MEAGVDGRAGVIVPRAAEGGNTSGIDLAIILSLRQEEKIARVMIRRKDPATLTTVQVLILEGRG